MMIVKYRRQKGFSSISTFLFCKFRVLKMSKIKIMESISSLAHVVARSFSLIGTAVANNGIAGIHVRFVELQRFSL